MDKIKDQLLTRRTFLKQAVSVAGVSIISTVLIRDAVAAKMSKASVHYQVNLKGKPDCDDCVHYIAAQSGKKNGACKLVEGEINPHGWCVSFAAKG